MGRAARFLIGLAAALAAGWIAYGPFGQGEAFIAMVEAQAGERLRETALPGVEVRFPRDPLRREAILSGPANDFQREGQGGFPGLNDRMLAVPGVSAVSWTDTGPVRGGPTLPLLAEVELLVTGFFLLGLGAGRLLFRPRREHFL